MSASPLIETVGEAAGNLDDNVHTDEAGNRDCGLGI